MSAAVAGYQLEREKPGLPAYLVDLYDMGRPENAFGVMSEEGLEAEPEKIGFMGLRTDKTVMFIQGPYYVKITSFGSGAGSLAIAARLSRSLGALKTSLPQFSRFPEKGALPEGRSFIRSDYLGLDFLSHVFEQKYQRGGKTFHAFLVEPKEGVERFVAHMLSFYRELGTEVVPFEKVWPVSRAFLEADRVINVPVVKHHSLSRCTLAMKNWYGILGGQRNQLHQNIHPSIADLAQAMRPTLTVMDATRVLMRNGPTGGSLDDVMTHNTIVVGLDEVAMDAYGMGILGVDPAEVRFMEIAQGRGLGLKDWKSLGPDELTV